MRWSLTFVIQVTTLGPLLAARTGVVPGGDDGTLTTGWSASSNSDNFPYLITPLEAIQMRARQARSSVSWFLKFRDLPGAAAANALD